MPGDGVTRRPPPGAAKPGRSRFVMKRRRKAAAAVVDESNDDEKEGVAAARWSGSLQDCGALEQHVSPAVERRRLYAMLAWRSDYADILRLEANTNRETISNLGEQRQSGYAKRLIRKGGEAAERIERASELRLNDVAGFLARAGNVHVVPWSQAMRSISFLHDQVSTATWSQERHARRVVGRPYAMSVLEEMVECQPPPCEERHDTIWSIGFDQTYVRGAGVARLSLCPAVHNPATVSMLCVAGAGTGSASRYRSLKTLYGDGTARKRKDDRMVYINGHVW